MSTQINPLVEEKQANRGLERFFIFASFITTFVLVIPTFANGTIYSVIELPRNIHGMIFIVLGVALMFAFSLSAKPRKARLAGAIALLCGILAFVLGPLYYLSILPITAGASLIIRGEYILGLE